MNNTEIARLMQLNRDVMNLERQIDAYKAERKQSLQNQKQAALRLIDLNAELRKGIANLDLLTKGGLTDG